MNATSPFLKLLLDLKSPVLWKPLVPRHSPDPMLNQTLLAAMEEKEERIETCRHRDSKGGSGEKGKY